MSCGWVEVSGNVILDESMPTAADTEDAAEGPCCSLSNNTTAAPGTQVVSKHVVTKLHLRHRPGACFVRQKQIPIEVCMQALRGTRTGQQVLQGAAAALFLVLAAQLGQGTSPISWPAATAASASIVSLVLRGWLSGLEQKFTYGDYDHAK